MTTANIDAFIVAGGLSPWLKSYASTEHRCLAPLGDKRLIDYIIAALQGSGRIRQVFDGQVQPRLRRYAA